ncbi:MAG: DUF1615 domain-containing protein [Lysobacteraceae bacterium]
MIEPVRPRAWRIAFTSACLSLLIVLLAGCDTGPPPPTPEQVRAQLKRLMPASVQDRTGWAADIQAAFAALDIEPSPQNLCSALAITEQESTFSANPAVPGLGKIARGEIERRAGRYKIPAFAVRAALQMKSPNGDTWDARIAAVRTEKELSDIFEEMISRVPMGKRLLARANPVHTGGPMQVSIAFAEAHAKERPYPYTVDGSIRHEVFTRRGGMYFGIAHLLGYPASYDKPLFRFADFNAGRYASRNAAFQNAVSVATGIALDLDGDVVRYRKGEDGSKVSATEAAVLTLTGKLGMAHDDIHRALADAGRQRFENSELYARMFELADKRNGRPLPRATLPRIRLNSPKITRKLTTEWFATRVNQRYQRCMKKAK